MEFGTGKLAAMGDDLGDVEKTRGTGPKTPDRLKTRR
jgi:hypothetical protein